MAKVLSQDEIAALLGSRDHFLSESGEPQASETISAYSFPRSGRLAKAHAEMLAIVHDRFARRASLSISTSLRLISRVHVRSIETLTYGEFLRTLPEPTAYYVSSLVGTELRVGLEVSPHLVFTMIDRLLGGAGRPPAVERELTEIEQNVFDEIVTLVLGDLSDAWSHVAQVRFDIHARTTRPAAIEFAGGQENVVAVTCELIAGDVRGVLNLCLPITAVETLSTPSANTDALTELDASTEERQHLLKNLGAVPVKVAVQLDALVSTRDVLELRSGDVLSLGWPLSHALDVTVGGLKKFAGRPALVARNAGILIESTMQSES